MTEDTPDGCFYRFTPTVYPDLSSGTLEVLVGVAGRAGDVGGGARPERDRRRPDPPPGRRRRALQRRRGRLVRQRHRLLLDQGRQPDLVVRHAHATCSTCSTTARRRRTPGSPGSTTSRCRASGDLFGCEDNGEAGVLGRDHHAASARRRASSPPAGRTTQGSELAGVIFDPSGKRMYFASQRGVRHGRGLRGDRAVPHRPAGRRGGRRRRRRPARPRRAGRRRRSPPTAPG